VIFLLFGEAALKRTFLLFIVMLFILTSCGNTPTPVAKTYATFTPIASATPFQTPTAIGSIWEDSLLIDPSSQVVFSNATQEYQGKEIFGSGIALDTDT
jgi:flagellar basal body L-ring protein FlgH